MPLTIHAARLTVDSDKHCDNGMSGALFTLGISMLQTGSAPAAGGDGADVGALQHGLVDDAGVVVQPARQAEVERHARQGPLAAQLPEQLPQVAQCCRCVLVAAQRVPCRPSCPSGPACKEGRGRGKQRVVSGVVRAWPALVSPSGFAWKQFERTSQQKEENARSGPDMLRQANGCTEAKTLVHD